LRGRWRWLCLLPFRYRPHETAFIGWVGLRGAVPIVLALFPLMAGVPQSSLIFNVVLVVVLASLLAQGMTIALAARRFGVALHPRPEPALRTPLDPSGQREMVMFALTAEHPWLGARADGLQLTPGTELFAIGRAGHALSTTAAATLQVDDALWFTSPPEQVDRLCDLFGAGADHAPQTLHFVFDAAASLADVLALYAPGATAAPEDSLADAICRVHRVPVEGDTVRLGRIRLTVVAMEGAAIRRVAATIEQDGPRASDVGGA
jgi:potassium/hydrogen antiporter